MSCSVQVFGQHFSTNTLFHSVYQLLDVLWENTFLTLLLSSLFHLLSPSNSIYSPTAPLERSHCVKIYCFKLGSISYSLNFQNLFYKTKNQWCFNFKIDEINFVLEMLKSVTKTPKLTKMAQYSSPQMIWHLLLLWLKFCCRLGLLWN